MAKINTKSFNMENESSAITITKADGTIIKTTFGAMQKARQAQKRAEAKTKKAKKTTSLHKLNAEQAIRLVKSLKVLKSLSAYREHGYRQWGKICRDNVINHPYISTPLGRVYLKYNEIEEQIDAIEAERKNSKDVYQLIEKLSFLIDDIKGIMTELTKGIRDSRVCEFYADHEMINGDKRRLGLAVLMQKSLLALLDIDNIFAEVNSIGVNGADISTYNTEGSFSRF